MLIMRTTARCRIMAGQPLIVSGEWTDDNLDSEYTPLSQGAPGQMRETMASQRLSLVRLPLDPVYVESVDGAEVLHYREADMVMGRPYRFRWYGEEFAALRSEAGVELLKRVSDEG